jgi:hypothetical protein
MLTGEVYKWVTTQARGHAQRDKYHVFVCEHGVYQNVFLFINSENYFQDFEIYQSDYPFLTKPSSFIGCEGVVCYENSEIARLTSNDCLGRLTTECMTRLANHLAGSQVMTGRDINIVFSALISAQST